MKKNSQRIINKDLVYSLDFQNIIEKMVTLGGWMKKDAILTCELYKNFLFLKKKYGQEYVLPPTLDVDEFWHNHILDTKKYKEDCQIIFGEYLHHYPYYGIDKVTTKKDVEQAFQNTQELHLKEFGFTIPATRSRFAGPIYFVLKKIFS